MTARRAAHPRPRGDNERVSAEPTIIAAAEQPYTRHPAPGLTTPELLAAAARRALDDAGLEPRAIDGLGVASFTLAPDHAIDLAVSLGLRVSWLMDGATGGAAGIDMLQHALRAVAAGDATCILLVAGDVFHAGAFAQLVDGYNVATRERLAPIPFGGPNALFSLLTQRHMRAHGLERADYGRLVCAQRAWAAGNPGAVYRAPLSAAEYLAAPLVADPLGRLDCVPVVAGADALIVAASGGGVRVRALRAAHNWDQHDGDGLTTGLAALSERLWADARASARQMDVVSVYDDYPAMALIQLDRPRLRRARGAARRDRDAQPPGQHLGRPALGRPGGRGRGHARHRRGGRAAARPRRRAPGRGRAPRARERLRHGRLPPRGMRERGRPGGPVSGAAISRCAGCGWQGTPRRLWCPACGAAAVEQVAVTGGSVAESHDRAPLRERRAPAGRGREHRGRRRRRADRTPRGHGARRPHDPFRRPRGARRRARRGAIMTRASYVADEVYPLVIGGREVATRESFPIVDPSTGESWARMGEASPADVEDAVAAARGAFAGWRETSPGTRQATLERIAAALEDDPDWPAMLATENGRPIREARIADVPTAADVFRYFGGLARGLEGAFVPTGSRDSLVWTTREPLGVIGALIPWNSPLISTALKVAPALAAGNTIVLKPSELASASVVEFARRVGHLLPEGVVNVVTGLGPQAGAALVASPGIAKISFTGGIPTARRILASAADNITPALLELGGKSAFVICEDADLDAAVADAVMGIAFQNGQVCFAASRLFVHAAVREQFLERFSARLAGLRIGDALDETTHVGPLVSAAHLERVHGFVAKAHAEGARVIGGERLAREGALAGGFYLEPAIIDDPEGTTTAVREEIFGPVTTVQSWSDEDDVIARANGTEYGLAAGVWTSDLGRAHRIAQRLEAGTVWINTWFDVVAGQPLGGVKASGYGREMCAETMLEYTSAKAISMRLSTARYDLWS